MDRTMSIKYFFDILSAFYFNKDINNNPLMERYISVIGIYLLLLIQKEK